MSDDDIPAALEAARQIREGVRTLNHLTIRGDGGIAYPSDLDQVVRSLAEAAHGLPQTLEQLAQIADKLTRRRGLYDDRIPEARDAGGNTAAWAAAELVDAQPHADGLGKALDRAAGQLSHLGVHDA